MDTTFGLTGLSTLVTGAKTILTAVEFISGLMDASTTVNGLTTSCTGGESTFTRMASGTKVSS